MIAIASIAIDGHVHLREPRHDGDALRAAARNFQQFCPVPARLGVLMLAEARAEAAFERLRRAAGRAAGSGFICSATAEAESLWIDVSGWRLLVVAGQQLVTAEGLELLALATTHRFNDGSALSALIDAVAERDALAVLPWACGKWLGARRREVHSALRRDTAHGVLLGDNGSRPALWPEPLFGSGRRLLRGTDPLPLPGQWQRIGCFGSALETTLSASQPAADLRRALREPRAVLLPYGPHRRPGRFLLDQLQLRVGPRGSVSAQGA